MDFAQNGKIRTCLLQEAQNGFAKIKNKTLQLSNITQILGWFMQNGKIVLNADTIEKAFKSGLTF